MTEELNKSRRVSIVFLLAGIAFLILAVVRYLGGEASFAAFLAVGLGNLVVGLLIRVNSNRDFISEERANRSGEKPDDDLREEKS